MSSTSQRGRLVPARPPEPLAGAPDRSPIPLADSVGGGVAAVSAGAQRAKSRRRQRARGGFVDRLQDLLPRRGPRYRRVTPAATRRESQRRAAFAVLAFVAVVAVLGIGLWVIGGTRRRVHRRGDRRARRRSTAAQEDVRLVFDNGANLVADDPNGAEDLLMDAYEQTRGGGGPGSPRRPSGSARRWSPASTTSTASSTSRPGPPSRSTARSSRSTSSTSSAARTARPTSSTPRRRRSTGSTCRARRPRSSSRPARARAARRWGTSASSPRAARTCSSLDDKNILWRWRPADKKGKGTLARIRVAEASTWGNDILRIGTFVRNADTGLYNLYVVDPSEQQILRYSPAADGSGYPGRRHGLPRRPRRTSRGSPRAVHRRRPVRRRTTGRVTRYLRRSQRRLEPRRPRRRRSSARPRRTASSRPPASAARAVCTLYDPGNDRVIAFDKGNGRLRRAVPVAEGGPDWADLRAIYVVEPRRATRPRSSSGSRATAGDGDAAGRRGRSRRPSPVGQPGGVPDADAEGDHEAEGNPQALSAPGARPASDVAPVRRRLRGPRPASARVG